MVLFFLFRHVSCLFCSFFILDSQLFFVRMLFLLFFAFFPFLLLFSICSFFFSLIFSHRCRSTQRRYVAGLFHDFFFLFIFSFFFLSLFFFLLFHLNAETLRCFSCLNVTPIFSTKRFNLCQVSVPGIIPSSLHLGLGPAGSC